MKREDRGELVTTSVPSVPAAMRALDAMQHELNNANTYNKMMSIVDRAEALKLLLKDVDGVKLKAEDTILLAHKRIGEELAKVPNAPRGIVRVPKRER